MQVKGRRVNNTVCMILLECIGEEMYDGCQAGFVCVCVCVCAEVSSYKDMDVYGHEEGFYVVCLGTCI